MDQNISEEMEIHAILNGPRCPVTSLDFNPNDNQLSVASEDHSIITWNNWKTSLDSSPCIQFTGHSGPVTAIEYSKQGTIFASCSKDKDICLWEPRATGGCKTFIAHTSSVNTISFSPDNIKLLSGSNDKSVKLWDVNTQTFLSNYSGNNNWVRCVKFSALGDTIFSCGDDKTIRMWDSRSRELIHTISTPEIPNYITIHGNDKNVAAAMDNGSIRIYDYRQSKLVQLYLSIHNNTTCLDWHPSYKYLLSGGLDGNLQIIDILEARPIHTLSYLNSINTCKFNCNGEYIASGGIDKQIVIWKMIKI